MLYFYGILEDNRHCDMTSTFVLYGNNQGPLWSSHITNGVTFSDAEVEKEPVKDLV